MNKHTKKICIFFIVVLVIILIILVKNSSGERSYKQVSEVNELIYKTKFAYNDGNVQMVIEPNKEERIEVNYKDGDINRKFIFGQGKGNLKWKDIYFVEYSERINLVGIDKEEIEQGKYITESYEVLKGKINVTKNEITIKIESCSILPTSVKEIVFYPVSDLEAMMIKNNKWVCDYDENASFEYEMTGNENGIIKYKIGEESGTWDAICYPKENDHDIIEIMFQKAIPEKKSIIKKDILHGEIYLTNDDEIKIKVLVNCTERSDIEELIFHKEDTNENNIM